MRVWQVIWQPAQSDGYQLAWFTTRVKAEEGIKELRRQVKHRATFGCESVNIPVASKEEFVAWLNTHVNQEIRMGQNRHTHRHVGHVLFRR